MIHCCCTI